MKEKNLERFINIGCLFIICIYFFSILYINFADNSLFYVTDMYSDMNYAAEVWKQKSIFPDGWVFGNQIYVVATPVLAAVFFGLTHNYCLAMGIASSLMGIFTILSFNWMLKPILKSTSERLICISAFMTIVLFFSDPIYATNGWQLFFTMCSFYSCYTITAFLVFGCYLRSEHIFKFPSIAILILSCFLSFGTGFQSVRQTVIMICPLIVVESLRIIYKKIRKDKISLKPLFVNLLFVFFNLLGMICLKLVDVQRVEIFGKTELISPSDIFSSIFESVKNVIQLFSLLDIIKSPSIFNLIVSVLFVVSIIILLVFAFIKLKINPKQNINLCISLFIISIICILLIDIFTNVKVRSIYYFMLFAFIALIVGCTYSFSKNIVKGLIFTLFFFAFLVNVKSELYPLIGLSKQPSPYIEVSDYLIEKNFTTIFSRWDLGEKIAIESDWKIQAGFWDTSDDAFESVKYLCNPKIFTTDPESCAYIFKGKESVDKAMEVVQENNFDFTLVKYFPDNDLYIYTSKDHIMQLY